MEAAEAGSSNPSSLLTAGECDRVTADTTSAPADRPVGDDCWRGVTVAAVGWVGDDGPALALPALDAAIPPAAPSFSSTAKRLASGWECESGATTAAGTTA